MSGNITGKLYDLIIIGGGASGLMCASYLHFLKPNASILVLERNNKIGNKIYITGNGRCNLTNISATSVDYYTDNYERINRILAAYGVKDTIDYFENVLGLHVQYKEDLVYPYSNKSSSVVDCFKFHLNSIDIICDCFVTSTKKTEEGFEVTASNTTYNARNVVFAGGGSAAPKTGSDGNIYKLILPYATRKDFTQVMPSLVQLKTLEKDTSPIAGTRVQADITLKKGDTSVASYEGEMMFTDYGISGICVFCISGNYCQCALNGDKNLKVVANLMPGNNKEDIYNQLLNKVNSFPDRTLKQILMGYFTKELSEIIISRGNNDLKQIASVIYEFTYTITGTMGFDNAQVTLGGLNLSCLNDNLMLDDGVYVIGEAVNVSGPCGGYNLQWAWSSGMAAAAGISEGLN